MLHTLAICLLIIVARVSDVTLGTLRTVAIINGRRGLSWFLGFFEVLIWIYAVSAVLQGGIRSPWVAIAYALGFATGNYVGITVEQMLAHGEQMVKIFTRRGPEMACLLRRQGFAVTQLEAEGRDGRVDLLFVKTQRKATARLTAFARRADDHCFYTVESIRYSSDMAAASSLLSLRGIVEKLRITRARSDREGSTETRRRGETAGIPTTTVADGPSSETTDREIEGPGQVEKRRGQQR